MNCPSCGSVNREGAAFCGKCGAAMGQPAPQQPPAPDPAKQPPAPAPAQQPPQAAPPTQPLPVAPPPVAQQPPTQPPQPPAPPQQPPAQTYPPQAAYAPAQAPAAGYPPAQPAAGYPAPGTAGPPPKKSSGAVIAIVIIVLLLLCACCGGGGYYAYLRVNPTSPETTGTVTPTDSVTPTAGQPTAEAALVALLQEKGASDWVYKVSTQQQGTIVYWIGPPNSEFTDEVTVMQNPDGTWTVQGVQPLGGDTSSPGGSSSGSQVAAQASAVVDQFLRYVQTDQGLKAQALTIEPFHSDSASAQAAAGQLESWTLTVVNEGDDGEVQVKSSEKWKTGDQSWIYIVVPSGNSYRISDLKPG